MPLRKYPMRSPMTEAQRIAHEDRMAVRNSIMRMGRSYDTRRREDALNYQDDIELGASRRAAAAPPTPPTAEHGQPDARENLVTEEMDCEEESSGAPAP